MRLKDNRKQHTPRPVDPHGTIVSGAVRFRIRPLGQDLRLWSCKTTQPSLSRRTSRTRRQWPKGPVSRARWISQESSHMEGESSCYILDILRLHLGQAPSAGAPSKVYMQDLRGKSAARLAIPHSSRPSLERRSLRCAGLPLFIESVYPPCCNLVGSISMGQPRLLAPSPILAC